MHLMAVSHASPHIYIILGTPSNFVGLNRMCPARKHFQQWTWSLHGKIGFSLLHHRSLYHGIGFLSRRLGSRRHCDETPTYAGEVAFQCILMALSHASPPIYIIWGTPAPETGCGNSNPNCVLRAMILSYGLRRCTARSSFVQRGLTFATGSDCVLRGLTLK